MTMMLRRNPPEVRVTSGQKPTEQDYLPCIANFCRIVLNIF